MKFLFRPRAFACALVLACAAALPFLSTAILGQNVFFFEATVSANVPAGVQLFYDVGRGFNEPDSVYLSLYNHAKPGLYRFPLPAGEYRALRLDPIDTPGFATVANARIVDGYGDVIRRFPSEQFRPAHQIAESVIKSGVVEMTTVPGGNDPSYVIDFGAAFDLKTGPAYLFRAAAPAFTIVFALAILLAGLPAAPLRRCWRWCAGHPGRAIAAGSALTVTLACHPVIFFGKSFVSPDNGVLLLHDHHPTLPSPIKEDVEWPQYSDIGALMWWHLYCPALVRDALFRDHELPLWDRYDMSGLPLLGQGQSMAGDPLNWLPILAGSAAWSWDLKFLIARWLLCCGLGLTVYALTRHLAASLLVAGAAGFLGFFVFRLNHPANFSVCYSPWILLAWMGLVRAGHSRALARRCLGLMLANFAVMTSGTVKEAYILIACLNFAGVLLLLFDSAPLRQRTAAFAWAAGAGATFLLLTAPWWRTFLAALKHSWTIYDIPAASQIPLPKIIGFFDDMFSRQMLEREKTYMPAVNFLILLGVLWAVAGWRNVGPRRALVALLLGSALPFSFAFAVIPARFITAMPFIANIISVDNSFSCPLLILSAVVAGIGFAAFAQSVGRRGWWFEFGGVVLFSGALYGLFFVCYPETPKSPFFIGYASSLAVALVLIPLCLKRARVNRDGPLAVAVLILGSFLLMWRCGQYLKTPFDYYVFNPKKRLELNPPSAAIAEVGARLKQPSRPIGFGLNLFAGYNQMLRWESILGVEALRSRYYDKLAVALGVARVGNWADPMPESREAEFRPSLDMLNVRYYLSSPDLGVGDIPGLMLIGRHDFNVYESPTAWPRAFFTDTLSHYDSLEQFAAQVKGGDGRPFASVQTQDEETLPAPGGELPSELSRRKIVSADGYRLTTNTTSFSIVAPSAGLIVLTENYFPHDFLVRINGRPSPYFRVNHSFKGVYVAHAGAYKVEFEYWPRSLNLSLQLAAAGLLGLAGFVAAAVRRTPDGHSPP